MFSRDKSDIKTRIISSNFFLFVILLGLLGIVMAVANVSYKKYLLNKEIKDLGGRIEKLGRENGELGQEIEYQKTPEFLEKELRRKLNLKKEGENVIIVPSQKNTD